MPFPIATAIEVGGSLLSGLLSSSSAEKQNERIMSQQQEYSKELMALQHKYNSPKQYLQDLEGTGLNPGQLYKDGANQLSTSLGSSPSSDLGGAIQAQLIGAQIANISSQTMVNQSVAKKNEKEAEKIGAETEGILTSNEFLVAAKQGELDLLYSQEFLNWSHVDVNNQSVVNMHKEYEKLVAETDKLEAEKDYINQNKDYLLEQTNLAKLHQIIDNNLAESQLQNDAAARAVSYHQASLLLKQGIGTDLDNDIKGIQKQYVSKNESLNQEILQNKSRTSRYEASSAKYKAKADERFSDVERGVSVANVVVKSIGELVNDVKSLKSLTPMGQAKDALGGIIKSGAVK